MECFSCKSCMGEYFLVISDDQNTLKKECVCRECFSKKFKEYKAKCENCNCYSEIESCYYSPRSKKFLCKYCINRYTFCARCGNVFENDTDCVCYECRSPKFIRSYFYKPSPCFYDHELPVSIEKSGKIFIGVELEIGGGTLSDIEKFLSKNFANQFFYFKSDVSIPKYGFEIVSHPATIEGHFNLLPWKEIFEDLKQLQINKTENCGIHFHINRDFFNEEEIAVADFLINYFSSFFSIIGEREFNRYCSASIKRTADWGRSRLSQHHHSVNLTNRNTIEFRFFKSTNNIENLFLKLDFINKFCNFIKNKKTKEFIIDEYEANENKIKKEEEIKKELLSVFETEIKKLV